MNDMVVDTSTAPLSTQLDSGATPAASGGGAPATLNEPAPASNAKPESVRDSLMAEAKSISDEEAETAKVVKPEKELKQPEKVEVEKGEKGKELPKEPEISKNATAEKPDVTEQAKDQAQERKSENRDRPEPPARFLPKAKEVWRNVPQAVQAEVSRMVSDHENEVSQYRESHAFREELKEFEDLGKQHGVTVKDALKNYVGIEQKFNQEPSAGFKQLLSNLNMQPQQAISHILQAFGVSPQALAQHISQSPDEYISRQNNPQRQQPAQQQQDPMVSQLQQQLSDMQITMAHEKYVAPFANEHPRYKELEGDIAFFLQSGKIPSSLSPSEKLEAAYDMAERINPSSNIAQISSRDEIPLSRVDNDSNGSKSVKSSPGSVLDITEPERKMSMRELLEDELRRSKRA